MFHSKFGIADHLKIPRTDSIEDFSRFFSPHEARAIRIALKLKDNSLIGEVKKHLIGKTVCTGMQTNESKLDGMPEGISIDEVKKSEKELTPLLAEMFGIDGAPSEYELHVVTNLVLGVLQREKHGLDLDTPDEKLFEHMMK